MEGEREGGAEEPRGEALEEGQPASDGADSRQGDSELNGGLLSEDRSEADEREELLDDTPLSAVLKVTKQAIDFGELFPGQIVEENLMITNNLQRRKVPFKIKVNCLAREFDELDEYVYSMRRPSPNEIFNYNDTFLILLAPKTLSSYKLAIKVPAVHAEQDILGAIEISSAECAGEPIIIPIRTRVVLPALRCEKMIYLNSIRMSVLKLFMKNAKRQEFRISLKNLVRQTMTVEFQALKNERHAHLEFSFYPPSLSLSPLLSSNFIANVKSNKAEEEMEEDEVRCVLLVKMKNGSPIFGFPVIIVFGE